ncbi:MAG: succinate dehydrogenase, cytochrome b556 subunit [Streptosporangiales bacterium]|nr:succinate dehydrogenase, cytochrome b556 subunit [Streptosporangiales bacterium]MBO0891279.1 succinate dehydrogenase, cytochrome b556 subunit [Acidothermales bacterium]
MSAAQGVFLGAFTVVVLAVVGFAAVVLVSARRIDGGGFVGVALRRMARSRRERAEAARWAFYAHRISGFGIFAFLCLHVVDVSLYAVSPSLYDDVHALYGTAPMRVFECALLVAICFHTLNGLRLLAVDVADLGLTASLRLLGGVASLTVVAAVAGSAVILGPVT